VTELEAATLVPRLLYCELVPRNLEWAEELENRFIAPDVSKATVPFVTASDTPMQLDGQATETVWQRAATNGTPDFGVLSARPSGSSGSLTVCRDENRLYLLCTCPSVLEKPVLTLQFLTQFEIRPEQSPSWKLVVDQSGAAQLYKAVGGREYPQEAEITAELLSGAEQYAVEIAVPFAAFEILQTPLQGSRWRLSATLIDAQEEADHAMYWGRAPGTSPVHGAILQFGPSM